MSKTEMRVENITTDKALQSGAETITEIINSHRRDVCDLMDRQAVDRNTLVMHTQAIAGLVAEVKELREQTATKSDLKIEVRQIINAKAAIDPDKKTIRAACRMILSNAYSDDSDVATLAKWLPT